MVGPDFGVVAIFGAADAPSFEVPGVDVAGVEAVEFLGAVVDDVLGVADVVVDEVLGVADVVVDEVLGVADVVVDDVLGAADAEFFGVEGTPQARRGGFHF